VVLLAHLTIYIFVLLFGELNGMIYHNGMICHTSLLAPHVHVISLRLNNRLLPPKLIGWSMMDHSVLDEVFSQTKQPLIE
jgi:hypothetical protein